MARLFQVAYISTASDFFDKRALREILRESNGRNAEAGVTGMLLYKNGHFMQVLEGAEDAVKATFQRIQRDPRHHGIIVLLEGPVEQRHFQTWSMAFRDLDLPDHQDVPGYSEFLNTPLTGVEFAGDPSRCEKLLLLFKKNVV
ncbi:MAG: BLUF domain-containing protein [Verrucomicrobiota bacterium]|nr:BLUF domain-containing protein [Verrucomicrobiota bacterium]